MVLAHTRGFPQWPDLLKWDDLHDWDKVVAVMESAVVEFEPGTTAAYHAFNHGWVCAEIVRRVTNTALPQFFRSEIAEPLGMGDTYIGAPVELLPRVAKIHPYADIPSEYVWVVEKFNHAEVLTANIPAATGISTARDMARFYAALLNGGAIDGTRIWSEGIVRAATETEFEGEDRVQATLARRSAGFVIGGTPQHAVRMGSDTTHLTFGHGGAGTSVCWADRELNVAMAFIPNGFHGDAVKVARNREISDAVRGWARRTLGNCRPDLTGRDT